MNKPKKIGNVHLTWLPSADLASVKYSDGDAEIKLMDIYSSNNPHEAIIETLSGKPSWPLYYHLSPLRHNIVNWYNFKPNASVLEIGAGCGAITEALAKKGLNVTALELTARRAKINALRNKHAENVSVVVGNMEDYIPHAKFDYVVCVGVLEYAGSFISSDSPYEDFLEQIKTFLQPDGKLILAIENRLGLKYFAGAREDHTGGFFDGINQYPNPKKVQTFGKLELSKLLEKAGFIFSDFRYPYPDYKHPQFIYSDNYYPNNEIAFPLGLLPAPALDQNRAYLFSEPLAMRSIEKNDLYREFSNSFVVVGSMVKDSSSQNAFFVSQPARKAEYRIETVIDYSSAKEYIVQKKALTKHSIKHINGMFEFYTTQIKLGNQALVASAQIVEDGCIQLEYIDGVSLERTIFDCIVSDHRSEIETLLDKYVQFVHKINRNKQVVCIDLNFDNIIVTKNGSLRLIDYEWISNQEIDIKLIINRAFVVFLMRYTESMRYISGRIEMVELYKGVVCPQYLVDQFLLTSAEIRALRIFEEQFQDKVLDTADNAFNLVANSNHNNISPPSSTTEEIVSLLPVLHRSIDELQISLQKMLSRAESAENDYLNLKKEYDRLQSKDIWYQGKRLISKIKRTIQ